MSTAQIDKPRTRRWTREEFYQMMDLGWFLGQSVELIRGEIIEMPNQKSGHYAGIDKAARRLEQHFAAGFWIRTQAPLALEQDSEPNPDISLVSGSREDYLDHHPSMATLVVEVSDSTLRYYRGAKGSLYASGGLVEYWIVNLPDRKLEVYRDPQPDSGESYGYRYGSVQILGPDETVSPLALSGGKIQVVDLLP